MAWFYEIDGQQVGPVSGMEIVDLIYAKEISPKTRVWSEGMDDWRQAINTEFKSKFPPPLNNMSNSNNTHHENETTSTKDAIKKYTHHFKGKYIQDVACHVEGFLKLKKLKTQVLCENNKYIIQGAMDHWFVKFAGADLAATVILEIKEDDLEISLGATKWADKVAKGTLGLLFFYPLAISSGLGVIMQKKLFKDIHKSIEKYLLYKD